MIERWILEAIDRTRRTVDVVGRMSGGVLRQLDLGVGPFRFTPEGLDAMRHVLIRQIRHALEIPDAVASGLVSGSAADTVTVVRTLLDPSRFDPRNDQPPDDELVRRRFDQLLARSIDVEDMQGEPAFLDIVAQLSPDEARIIRLFADENAVPVVDLEAVSLVGRATRVVLEHESAVGDRAGCSSPERTREYLENLERLGLVAFHDTELSGHADYGLIEGAPTYAREHRAIRQERGVRPRVRRRSIRLTAAGQRFVDLCLGRREVGGASRDDDGATPR